MRGLFWLGCLGCVVVAVVVVVVFGVGVGVTVGNDREGDGDDAGVSRCRWMFTWKPVFVPNSPDRGGQAVAPTSPTGLAFVMNLDCQPGSHEGEYVEAGTRTHPNIPSAKKNESRGP